MFFQRLNPLFIGRFAKLFHDSVFGHAFSTRRGGVSSTPFDSLNLGYRTADLPKYVRENRERFFHALGTTADSAAIPEQVHGRHVVYVRESGEISRTDGLITDIPGLHLIVQVADCVPVFLIDNLNRAVGLLHAGWRGTQEGIVQSGIRRMTEHFGTRPEEIRVFLGPSIGACCYVVGQEVADHFPDHTDQDGHLDLCGAVKQLLVREGIPDRAVVTSGLCTSCHSDWFFSHRGSGGRTGRMMASVWIRNKSA